MEKAVLNVSNKLGKSTAENLRAYFERVGKMPGANRLFKRIESASDEDQLADYLAEIYYALVFAGLGFQVEVEPRGKDGPDLEISREGHRAVVEVMRFRKVYPGPVTVNATSEINELPVYGDPPRDIQKAFDKILTKFRQVQNDESIIAIWNDDEDLEHFEVREAVKNILAAEARGTLIIPLGLLFILYGSKWIGINRRQFYCFPVSYTTHGHQVIWQKELESSIMKELVQQALAQLHSAT